MPGGKKLKGETIESNKKSTFSRFVINAKVCLSQSIKALTHNSLSLILYLWDKFKNELDKSEKNSGRRHVFLQMSYNSEIQFDLLNMTRILPSNLYCLSEVARLKL